MDDKISEPVSETDAKLLIGLGGVWLVVTIIFTISVNAISINSFAWLTLVVSKISDSWQSFENYKITISIFITIVTYGDPRILMIPFYIGSLVVTCICFGEERRGMICWSHFIVRSHSPPTWEILATSLMYFLLFCFQFGLMIVILIKRQILRMLLISKRGPHTTVGADAPRVMF